MLTVRELATVLAALRHWQRWREVNRPDQALWQIATDCGRHEPLDSGQIDALCQRLNAPGSQAALRYVLYDFDADELITTLVYASYAAAKEDAEELSDILIVPLVLDVPGLDSDADNDQTEGPRDRESPS